MFEPNLQGLPATTRSSLFEEAVRIGLQLLDAWYLRAASIGHWKQIAAPGTPLGESKIENSEIKFDNGDRLVAVDSETDQFKVSSYQVMKRFLEDRIDMPLSRSLAGEIRKVAGAIKVIVGHREACNELLREALEAPSWHGDG